MDANIEEQWLTFLRRLEFVKHYPLPYSLHTTGGMPPRNPILENILPNQFFIILVSILDQAMSKFIESNDVSVKREDLHNRIMALSFLDDWPQDELLDLKNRRNEVAHESESKVTWIELEAAISVVDLVLQRLSRVGHRPIFKVSGERKALQQTSNPAILGVQEYRVILFENDKPQMEFSWSRKLMND